LHWQNGLTAYTTQKFLTFVNLFVGFEMAIALAYCRNGCPGIQITRELTAPTNTPSFRHYMNVLIFAIFPSFLQ
jgi:hypothetical protein